MYSLLLLGLASLVSTTSASSIKTFVAFGDSYTDQSRLSYFESNNSFPPKDYQSLYPPLGSSGDGEATWVRYVEIYGNLKSFNYAVAGAACSNFLTGRPGEGPPAYPEAFFPSVREYEIQAFVQDHITNHTSKGKTTSTNALDASSTVYSIWIGTNDVGFGALLTGNQTAGVSIVNVTECVIEWMETLYSFGARNFVFQNMIPLQLTPLYADRPGPLAFYWPYPHNKTEYAIEIAGLVAAGNALWDLQVPAALTKLPGAKAAVFNSYELFSDIFNNPSEFLNGTLPFNVTGYVASGAPVTSPDSFMWFDALHPSAQTDRTVARELTKGINGTGSKYITFFGDKF